jgi:hypothetical protein
MVTFRKKAIFLKPVNVEIRSVFRLVIYGMKKEIHLRLYEIATTMPATQHAAGNPSAPLGTNGQTNPKLILLKLIGPMKTSPAFMPELHQTSNSKPQTLNYLPFQKSAF